MNLYQQRNPLLVQFIHFLHNSFRSFRKKCQRLLQAAFCYLNIKINFISKKKVEITLSF